MTLTTARISRYTKPFTHTLALLDTVVHEVGHTVATLPFGTTLSIRINADGSGVTHGTMGVAEGTLFSAPTRVINLLAGYAAPILLGLFLTLTAFTPAIAVSTWWLVALSTYLFAALLFTMNLHSLGGYLMLMGWVATILAIFRAPAFSNRFGGDASNTFTGVELSAWVLIYIGVVLLLSVRSWFTLLITLVWFALLATVFLPKWENPNIIVFTLGIVFITTGIWTIIKMLRHLVTPEGGTDFSILTDEYGGHPVGWFVLFTLLLAGAVTIMFVLLL